MAEEQQKASLALRLTIKFLLNIVIVWVLTTYLDQYFSVEGGLAAFIIVGALITLMNIFVRPVLALLTLPLKLLATILAIMIVNGVFLYLTMLITDHMDPTVVKMEILGGVGGWIVVAIVFGFLNWVERELFRKR